MNISELHIAVLSRYIFLIPLVVGFLCEFTKLVLESKKSGKLVIEHFFHSGGFPSSHSAFVTSLLIIVWYKLGLESVEFAMAVTFAAVIWYDAMSSRREIGLQAEILNRLQRRKHLQTRIGHSLREVLGGITFGAIVTWVGIVASV
jgi:uncharacterized protein